MLVALVPPQARERMGSLSGASFRLDTWRDSLRLAASSPLLGLGLGAFHDAYPRFKRGHGIVRVEHAESDYLETLAETGVPGLALALAGLALLLAAAGRGVAEGKDRTVRGVGVGAAAALVALAAHSTVDFNLRIPSNAALAALAAAAAAGAAGVRPRPLSRSGAIVLAAGAAAVLLAAASLPDRPWLAARQEAVQAAASVAPAVRELRLERRGGRPRGPAPSPPRPRGVVAPARRHSRRARRRARGRGPGRCTPPGSIPSGRASPRPRLASPPRRRARLDPARRGG